MYKWMIEPTILVGAGSKPAPRIKTASKPAPLVNVIQTRRNVELSANQPPRNETSSEPGSFIPSSVFLEVKKT